MFRNFLASETPGQAKTLSRWNSLPKSARAFVPLVAALALASCAQVERGGAEMSGTPSRNPQLEMSTSIPSASAVSAKPQFRFDAIGGSNVIMVYPGPTESVVDKAHSGTYFSGDVADVVCKKEGRMITPPEDPSQESRMFYLLEGPAKHYATEAYGNLEPAGAVVGNCPSEP